MSWEFKAAGIVRLYYIFLNFQGVEQLFHKQTSDADPEDAVIVPEIHCPHQTRILFCSDTSPLNDWDLDLQTPDVMQIF